MKFLPLLEEDNTRSGEEYRKQWIGCPKCGWICRRYEASSHNYFKLYPRRHCKHCGIKQQMQLLDLNSAQRILLEDTHVNLSSG